MMRPLMIQPSPERFPKISVQPSPVIACVGDVVTYSVTAASQTPVTYKWQVSLDGITWIDLTDTAPYSGSAFASLKINPSALALNNNLYRCVLENFSGSTISNAALLT